VIAAELLCVQVVLAASIISKSGKGESAVSQWHLNDSFPFYFSVFMLIYHWVICILIFWFSGWCGLRLLLKGD